MRESSTMRLERRPKRASGRRGPAPTERPRVDSDFKSKLHPGAGEEILGEQGHDFWAERLGQYHARRVAASAARAAGETVAPGMPAVKGANHWTPIGPSVLARGQAPTRPPVGGRTSGLAIAPGGGRVYAATAVGGVWRSDDAGRSWRSCMDSFDDDPTNFASTSMACGAIAIDLVDLDRVYVGTGEGDTDHMFNRRLANALPAYRGIGVLRSDNGGKRWVMEPTAAGSESLVGSAFFALAVDPGNRENVVGATNKGLYQRRPAKTGYEWVQRLPGNHCSVVVTHRDGNTRFFAAAWGGGVVTSTDGANWTPVAGFEASRRTYGSKYWDPEIGRVALGVQPNDPNLLYAYIAGSKYVVWGRDAWGNKITTQLHSVQRLDAVGGAWKVVSGLPDAVLLQQGDYNLSVAVDPNNANRIYLSGNTKNFENQWTGAIHRCDIESSGAAYKAVTTYIGANSHSDVHVLAHSPGDSNALWAGCDGGVFKNEDPAGHGKFLPRNTGLAALCTNYFSQHPKEPSVIFCGIQDNGTGHYFGAESWRHVLSGDGGYCIVNWADPFKVITYANGSFYRATDGGQDYGSWTEHKFDWLVMAEPIVCPPPNPKAPAEADLVAAGVGKTIHFSEDFGEVFRDEVTLSSSGSIYSLVFANGKRLFAGMTDGQVFRVDKTAYGWEAKRIDNVGDDVIVDAEVDVLGHKGLVADIAIDWADDHRRSIYLCFGGHGDFRHVWHFDGSGWTARSGQKTDQHDTRLLDVEHNAIIVDPKHTSNVYVGADVGVWHSPDGGKNWGPMEAGLPDAPVFDLKIHPQGRLLRASLHGRGLYEWALDGKATPEVQLYLRNTILDTGRGVDTDGRPDPSVPRGSKVSHKHSPDIKIDLPGSKGFQTPRRDIEFYQFNEVIEDRSEKAGKKGLARAYVQLHNRGRVPAASARVVLLQAKRKGSAPPLPAGYAASVRSGKAISDSNWRTLAIETLADPRAGFPQVGSAELMSMPTSDGEKYCLLALAHHEQDGFDATETDVDRLCQADRKAVMKYTGSKLAALRTVTFNTTALSFDGQDDTIQSDYLAARLMDGTKEGRAYREQAAGADLEKVSLVATIEAWVRVRELPAPSDQKRASERCNVLHLGQSSAGAHYWSLDHEGRLVVGVASCKSQETSLEVGEWTHIASAHDGRRWHVYKNGELIGEPQEFSLAGFWAHGRDVSLIVGEDYHGKHFNGLLAELRVWNKPRSAEEIGANMYRQLRGDESGLVCYYREIVGGKAKDLVHGYTLHRVDKTKGGMQSIPVSMSFTVPEGL